MDMEWISYLRTYYDAYQNQNKNNIHNWLDENGNTGQISVDTVIALFLNPMLSSTVTFTKQLEKDGQRFTWENARC